MTDNGQAKSSEEQAAINHQAWLLSHYGPWERQVHEEPKKQEMLQKLWNLGHMDALLEHCLILESQGEI